MFDWPEQSHTSPTSTSLHGDRVRLALRLELERIAGLEGVEADRPFSVGRGRGGLGLAAQRHGHGFARIGPAPDGQRHVALQDHVVAEHAGQFHFGRRDRGEARQNEKGNHHLSQHVAGHRRNSLKVGLWGRVHGSKRFQPYWGQVCDCTLNSDAMQTISGSPPCWGCLWCRRPACLTCYGETRQAGRLHHKVGGEPYSSNPMDLMRIHSPFLPVPTGSKRSWRIGPCHVRLSDSLTR